MLKQQKTVNGTCVSYDSLSEEVQRNLYHSDCHSATVLPSTKTLKVLMASGDIRMSPFWQRRCLTSRHIRVSSPFLQLFFLQQSENHVICGQSVSSAILLFHVQTGERLQGRSSKGRERAWGNPQGYRRVWWKAVQQAAALWCEATLLNSGFHLFRLTHSWLYALWKTPKSSPQLRGYSCFHCNKRVCLVCDTLLYVQQQQSALILKGDFIFKVIHFICCVVGVCKAEVWWLNNSGNREPRRPISGR